MQEIQQKSPRSAAGKEQLQAIMKKRKIFTLKKRDNSMDAQQLKIEVSLLANTSEKRKADFLEDQENSPVCTSFKLAGKLNTCNAILMGDHIFPCFVDEGVFRPSDKRWATELLHSHKQDQDERSSSEGIRKAVIHAQSLLFGAISKKKTPVASGKKKDHRKGSDA